MDEVHRNKIEKYREHLIENTNFDALWETLTRDNYDNIFPEYMIQDILSTPNGCARNERFYNIIQTCDHPLSFQTLCNALSASGQNDLSLLLLSDKLLCTQADVSETAKYPHLPPLLHNLRVCRKSGLSSWGRQQMRDPMHAYYVQSSPRGYLLLINMMFRMNALSDQRFGSEVDVKNLRDLFTQLDYKIVEHHDLTLPEMERALHDFSHLEALSQVDSIVVFVMSHGRDLSKREPGEPPLRRPGRESVDIELEDNRFINSSDIADYINLSPTIRDNIPKLFFFNVCRGNKVNRKVGHSYPVSLDSGDHAIADTSTEVDAVAYRQPGEALSSNENNIHSNENTSNENNIHSNENTSNENNIHSNDRYVPSNGVQNNISLNGYHESKDSLTRDEQVTPMCGCFHLGCKNEDKSRSLCVRAAAWLSRHLRCSMPELQEEVSRHPDPAPPPQDSPDSEVPHDVLWRDPAAPALAAPVARSQSKASGQSHAGSIRSLLQRLTQRAPPEPRLGDMYMGFSTVDGYNSKRHPERGSWFVTLVCQVFAEQAKDTDLDTMMKDVDRRMRAMDDRRYGSQMYVKKEEGFSRKFFFNVRTDGS